MDPQLLARILQMMGQQQPQSIPGINGNIPVNPQPQQPTTNTLIGVRG